MTPFQIRLAAYLVIVLLLFGSGTWVGSHFTAKHYQASIAADKAAQDVALQDAQRNVIAAQQARAAALDKAEKDHAQLVKTDAATRDVLLGRVRDLEAAIHLLPVPAAVDPPAEPVGAPPRAGSPDGIERGVERLNRAIAGATAGCQHDSEELAAILSLSGSSKPLF